VEAEVVGSTSVSFAGLAGVVTLCIVDAEVDKHGCEDESGFLLAGDGVACPCSATPTLAKLLALSGGLGNAFAEDMLGMLTMIGTGRLNAPSRLVVVALLSERSEKIEVFARVLVLLFAKSSVPNEQLNESLSSASGEASSEASTIAEPL
jgi:hypothetical protein